MGAAAVKASSLPATLGHRLSGRLNFPRRVATAYYNAAVQRLHNDFLDAVEAALADAGIHAATRLLKADGGAVPTSLSRREPVQSILSGPAASVMGVMALCPETEQGCSLLLDMGFSPKETTRSGSSVLYFKQSNSIEDLLTTMGAPVSAMHIMEAKVEKDLRNSVNRRVNCETANLTKVVDAAQEQVGAIEQLMDSAQWDELSPVLQQTAQLRRDNPEATLQELAELSDPPVSKSAINHRLRKLLALAAH